MSITVACPYCQAKIKASEKVLGKTIQCPSCKQSLRLDSGDAPPPAPAPGGAFAFHGQAGGEVSVGDDMGSSRAPRPSAFWEFLTFRRMIAPVVLQVLFWLSVIGIIATGGMSVVGGLAVMGSSSKSEFGQGGTLAGLLLIVSGLAYMLIGPFVVRIFYEFAILIFRTYDVLREIRDKISRR